MSADVAEGMSGVGVELGMRDGGRVFEMGITRTPCPSGLFDSLR
jgi:hypothetical protein